MTPLQILPLQLRVRRRPNVGIRLALRQRSNAKTG
jgi:hypothetical protein